MKALLLKDAYVLWRQMRVFVLVLAVMSFAGTNFNNVFIVVWCSMLPYTAMAYDERSHWDQMAAMMPYSRRNIVLSKYVLGWVCMLASAVLSMALQTAISSFGYGSGPEVSVLLVSLLAGILSLDITMPMIFRFGVERGRMIFMLMIFGLAIAAGAVADLLEDMGRISLPVMALAPGLAVAATVISVPLSMKLYKVN